MELIDKIGEAVELLHGNYQEKEDTTIITEPKVLEEETPEPERIKEPKETSGDFPKTFISEDFHTTENRKGKPWTENEEELINFVFQTRQGYCDNSKCCGTNRDCYQIAPGYDGTNRLYLWAR